MGRPKKETNTEQAQEVETKGTALAIPEIAPPVDVGELKACPKCGADALKPYQDIHGHWRCNCSHPKCGFWDSQVYNSAEEAARGWQLAGGPDKSNW